MNIKSAKLAIAMLVILLASIFIPAGIALAASPSVDDVKVFTGYQETDDWLIVATYNISGSEANSSCDVYSNPWEIQLIDSTGHIYTENTIQQCGMRPVAIYLSAASASSMVWGDNYSVKIYGAFGATPNASKELTVSDWKGSNLVGLDQWAIKQAKTMQTFDAETYVETVAIYGDVLNVDGGYLFDTGIPYLSSYRPNIFLVTSETVPIYYTNTTGAGSYAEGLYNQPLADVWGTPIADALTSSGYYFGISGRVMGALLMFIGFVSLAVFSKTISFLIILGGVVLGLVPAWIVYVLVFLLAVILIRSLFWSST